MGANLLLILGFLSVFMRNVCCFIDTSLPQEFFNTALESSGVLAAPQSGGLSPYKFSFVFANTSEYASGWTRQITTSLWPIATSLAGAQMRLDKGGVRELHWHTVSEWAYMIYGEARITAVESNGLAFVGDLKAGDLWYFPRGVGHSIQGIGKHGAFFLIIFDDGNFNKNYTFALTDWLYHIPVNALASNFKTSPSTFNNLMTTAPYIFAAPLPRPLSEEKVEVIQGTGFVSEPLIFLASQMKPNVNRIGGEVKIIDKKNFPVTNISAAIVTLKRGAMRELHWHLDSDEWQYYIKGQGTMSVFHGNSQATTISVQAGDVAYVPISQGHYITNTGSTDLVFLEVFGYPYYSDISLAEWLAHTPHVLVNTTIRTGFNFIDSINKKETVIVP